MVGGCGFRACLLERRPVWGLGLAPRMGCATGSEWISPKIRIIHRAKATALPIPISIVGCANLVAIGDGIWPARLASSLLCLLLLPLRR